MATDLPCRRYFAYGSNMSASQMARRCPAAVADGLVTIPSWRFAINRRGVATLVPDAAKEVTGLIWRVTHACELSLDRHEGVNAGHYRKTYLEVSGGPVLAYLAADERPGVPRPGYLEGILDAAAALGVPSRYRDELAGWGKTVAPWLVAEVLAGYRLNPQGVHGPGHWMRVRSNGLALASRTPGADMAVVELFALLHDCRRIDEAADKGHGARAANYVRRLSKNGFLHLDTTRVDALVAACAGHELGQVNDDPTIGCCWDADRLELSRLGRRPIAALLSTKAAQDIAIQETAWRRGSDWALEPEAVSAWGLDSERLTSVFAA